MKRLVAIDVNEIADLREREERNCQRKNDVEVAELMVGRAAKRVQDKVRVFVISQQEQIEGDAENKGRFGGTMMTVTRDEFGDRVIHRDGNEQQRHVFDLPIGVEKD